MLTDITEVVNYWYGYWTYTEINREQSLKGKITSDESE